MRESEIGEEPNFWSPPLFGWQYWLELEPGRDRYITYSYKSDNFEISVEDYYGDLKNITVYVFIRGNGGNSMHDIRYYKLGGNLEEIFQYIESLINIKVAESRKIVTTLGIE